MREWETTAKLTKHFMRRFFENDVLESDGETSTTIARALAIVAAPGLIFAFFLQNSYPARTVWGRIEDQYFFVLLSFVAMGGVAIFEWEMLFPERLDFLVLAPLPLRPRQLLLAKAMALGGFMAAFLVAANVLGVFMLPAVSKTAFWRMVWAQSVAVSLAGIFAVSVVVAAGGVLVCVLPNGAFRRVLWVLQLVVTAVLGLLVVSYARFGDEIAKVLEHPGTVARCVPTVWFLGVYERLLHGNAAEAFASPAAQTAWQATALAFGAALLFYPMAWIRMQRAAMQGDATHARAPSPWWTGWQNRVVTKPTERAIFSFIGKTMSRNGRYQVYLAIYGGVGLALAISCGVASAPGAHRLKLALSGFGLHAVLPLLLFWTIAGLHTTFAVPQQLPARWIFRVAGVDPQACVQATRRWVIAAGVLVTVLLTGLCAMLGWQWRPLLVQAVYCVCFCVALVESFFVTQRGAPFSRPRAPGKTNLPAVLTLYIGVLPPLVFCIAWLEVRAEENVRDLLLPVALCIFLFGAMRWIRASFVWKGEEAEGAEGDFQLLGLSGQLRA